MSIEANFYLIPISIIVSIIAFFIARAIVNHKFKKLHGGRQKINGIISIVIAFVEIAFLGAAFGLFEFALEIITSVGVGIVFLGIALQHQLKNIVSGFGLYFGSDISVGDIVTIKEESGTIIEIHLTKTIALTDEGERLIIPNQKFAEDVTKIHPKKR